MVTCCASLKACLAIACRAEQVKTDESAARLTAQQQVAQAEAARKLAEDAKSQAETARDQAESARKSAQDQADSANAAAKSACDQAQLAQADKTAAQLAQARAEHERNSEAEARRSESDKVQKQYETYFRAMKKLRKQLRTAQQSNVTTGAARQVSKHLWHDAVMRCGMSCTLWHVRWKHLVFQDCQLIVCRGV